MKAAWDDGKKERRAKRASNLQLYKLLMDFAFKECDVENGGSGFKIIIAIFKFSQPYLTHIYKSHNDLTACTVQAIKSSHFGEVLPRREASYTQTITQIIYYFTCTHKPIVPLQPRGYALWMLYLMTWNWSAVSCYPSLRIETSGGYCEGNRVWPGQLMQNKLSRLRRLTQKGLMNLGGWE